MGLMPHNIDGNNLGCFARPVRPHYEAEGTVSKAGSASTSVV
jgi:hypothetical protein